MKRRVAKGIAFIVAVVFMFSLMGCEKKEQEKKQVKSEMGTPVSTEITQQPEEQPKVEFACEDSKVSIDLPKDWKYEVEEDGLRIWPEGYSEGEITILNHKDFFGVCGTGLRTKKIMLGGKEASQGTYDGDKMWSFIIFTDESIPYVICSDGASVWWEEYSQEAMKILDSIQF